ncbi:MAG: TIGR04282 family arsenosugar biosynthesis glycosyltransferase, partial [Planctomycetota bacterium]|nr:TIGR04282 family arsenosugar biosynthesis glycosyltransferase [Planctomycetota bacterium]
MVRPRTLVLEYAKRPVPGRVKTRLAATEGPREAARIYRVLANDMHAVLLEAQAHGEIDVAVCLPPEDHAASDDDWLAGARHRWSQGEGDLGARLAHGFAQGVTDYDAVFAVGTDVVGLDAGFLRSAIAALRVADVVLAPTPDGGYGLIGMRAQTARAHAATLFDDMPWSTDAVADTTRRRARDAGLTVREMVGLRDVDVAADLDGVLPTLAVLVPVWNEAPRLEQNLPPLLAQAARHGADVEVIVADGGSTDGSAEVAERLGARVLRTARGRGVQLRAAADAARARWLWTLHADAGIRPDAVETVLRWCARTPHAWGACPSRFVHP